MSTGTDDADVDHENADVDPEELRRQLSRIEEAVGLKEEYGTVVETWLVVGVLVAVASALSQYVYTNDLGGGLYGVIWLGVFLGGFVLYSYWQGGGNPFAVRPDRPNINVVIGVVYLGSLPLLAAVNHFTGDLAVREGTLLSLAVITILLGVGYVAAGHVLLAHRVRDRDRYPFFVGGVGMVALGVAMPRVDALAEWPYLAFGGGFLAFATATYAYLSWTEP